MDTKDLLIRNRLLSFYKNEKNLNTFLEIILQKTRLSLRSIDWFVTNYSKKKVISYSLNDKLFFPFKAYKAQLKAYSKKFCDPFCRRDRVKFDYKNFIFKPSEQKIDHDDYVLTTTGQLNFFKFAIENKIIDYAIENINDIEHDMNNTLKERTIEKKFVKVESLKRRELSKLGNKSICISEVKAVIRFE
jgi:hypothetical protein